MPAAVAVPLIVGAASAATQVYTSKKAADASKDAARTQERAADRAALAQERAAERALEFQREQFRAAQANLSPWVNMGQSSMRTLSHLVGLPGQTATAGPATGPAEPAPTSTTSGRMRDLVSGGARPRQMRSRADVDSGRDLPQAGLVRMVAPDGSEADIPEAQVDRALSLGARRAADAARAHASTYRRMQ